MNTSGCAPFDSGLLSILVFRLKVASGRERKLREDRTNGTLLRPSADPFLPYEISETSRSSMEHRTPTIGDPCFQSHGHPRKLCRRMRVSRCLALLVSIYTRLLLTLF